MPSIFKIINQQKKRIKTLGRIKLLISLFLTYLVGNNNFLSIRPIKRTKTTKKVFGTMVDKDRVETKIFL